MALTLRLTSAAPPSCTEHDLVAAARRGDDRAFEELYARYRTRIAAYILGPVGDHGRAEDLAQEVFLSALRRLRDTEQPIAFKPWIYEIAKNACIGEYRRTKRAREVSLEADDDLGAHDRVRLSSDLTPDAAVENKQRLDDLRGAFGGLSESHHKLLVMRELEGLSYDEIGTRQGMSRAMVESTLFRARRKLTEEYDELVSGRRCEQVQTAIDTLGARSLRSFGLRERRQLARHLAHCQPCRRMAHMSGVDESIFKPRGIAEKIAALLPFPILGWRRGGGARVRWPPEARINLPRCSRCRRPPASPIRRSRRSGSAAPRPRRWRRSRSPAPAVDWSPDSDRTPALGRRLALPRSARPTSPARSTDTPRARPAPRRPPARAQVLDCTPALPGRDAGDRRTAHVAPGAHDPRLRALAAAWGHRPRAAAPHHRPPVPPAPPWAAPGCRRSFPRCPPRARRGCPPCPASFAPSCPRSRPAAGRRRRPRSACPRSRFRRSPPS